MIQEEVDRVRKKKYRWLHTAPTTLALPLPKYQRQMLGMDEKLERAKKK